MKLLVQPDSGIAPLIAAIKRAKKSVEIAIFRFDIRELEKALEAAVSRGVVVHALIARVDQPGGRKAAAAARDAITRCRRHGVTHRRRPRPLSRQVRRHRSDVAMGVGLQLDRSW